MSARPLLSLLRRLRAERRGVALIEFAFAVPVLLTLFVGGYQLMDAISAYRKVTTTVRALADLTTQSTSLTPGGADQILNASAQIMAPYPTSAGVMRITQIKMDAAGKATVDWSRAKNGTGYTVGQTVVVPATMIQSNSYLVYSEINYQYVPNIASKMIGTIPFKDTIYMAPRNSTSVACTGC